MQLYLLQMVIDIGALYPSEMIFVLYMQVVLVTVEE